MGNQARVLKLGTRRSLLAWAQSSWVAREVERLNPGLRVELVGIDTRGDKIQDIPLSQVEGKEFFVAEIDKALLSGAVDFTVHSMKDLSLERPQALKLAAVPRRENPRDVILFSGDVVEKIRRGETLRIGTSSPRRLENIPPFLARALPQVASGGETASPRLEWVEIRGNVNTRLSRLHEPAGSDRKLEGVVLAMAGLARLWADEASGCKELARLFDNGAGGRLKWMVLPVQQCPAAPAQGALAVECRADDKVASEVLARFHDEATSKQIALERELLNQWGGGCHQRFGATARKVAGLDEMLCVRGKKQDGTFVEQLRWNAPSFSATGDVREWDGSYWRNEITNSESINADLREIENGAAVFVAHSRAASALTENARIWTSGVKSWFELARRGFWVEGCAESLGFEFLASETLKAPVLRLPALERWFVLTHEQAIPTWSGVLGGVKRVVPAYRITFKSDKNAEKALGDATHIFWSSGSQYDAMRAFVPNEARHACGPGKTADHLRKAGITALDIFPSAREWRLWIEKQK